jgi:hypothetical protein
MFISISQRVEKHEYRFGAASQASLKLIAAPKFRAGRREARPPSSRRYRRRAAFEQPSLWRLSRAASLNKGMSAAPRRPCRRQRHLKVRISAAKVRMQTILLFF